MKKTALLIILFITAVNLSSCGIYKRSDVKDNPVAADERVKKNLEEGRGVTLKKLTDRGSGTFDFASSNELWRASIDILDFVTFANASYSGGILITDWFNSNSEKDKELNRELKITVRFLSNEIRADGLNVILHKKTCNEINVCNVSKIKSTIGQEIKLAILKEAAVLKENEFVKDPNYKYPLSREGKQ